MEPLVDPGIVEELSAVSGTVIRRAHLDASGLSGREIACLVRAGTLERVHRGIYRVPLADELPGAAYLVAVRSVRETWPDRVVTGPAAVAALGLPFYGRPSKVHVGVDGRGGSSARSVLRTVAPPPPGQRTVVDGGEVACAARAALDAARLDSVVAGVVAADAALARGLTTPGELDAVLASMGRLRGVERSRVCRALTSAGSQSPGESWSAVVLHRHGLPAPERQVSFVDGSGRVGTVDFWWPDARVVGEFDGRVKYGRVNPSGRPPEDVLWSEKLREDRLRALGLGVVRWTTADLRRPAPWIGRLRRALAAGSARER